MKNYLCGPFVAMLILLLCFLFGMGALKQACESHTRKSKPPIKLESGDKIIHRIDIC
jgi:hypothetical protein